jgi:hypothetical protein
VERHRPHVKVGSSHDAAAGRSALVSRTRRSMKRSGMMRCRPGTVTVRGGPGSAMHHFASARAASHPGHVTARLASQSHDVKQPYATLLRGAAPQVLVSALSAVGSQGDAANSKNCGSISGCVGAMTVRIAVPSLRMKNSSGSQNGQFGHRMVNRSR